MDMLSALRGVTQQAEVYTFEGESTLVGYEANEMKSAEVEETQGIALRGIVNGRLGFTAASGRIAQSQLLDNLLASVEYGDEARVVFPPFAPGPEVETYDPTLTEVPIARLAEIGREVVARLQEADEDAKIDVNVERSVALSCLRNSAGSETQQRTSSLSMGIGVQRVRGDDVLIAYDSVTGISLNDAYRETVQRLARRIELAKISGSLDSGRMPVLFSPAGALVLGLPIMLASNGKNVHRGTSPLREKLGQMVFDPQLTIWDDPTLSGRPASGSHDDEGVPCRRKALILQGTCNSYMYDLKTAALMGTESTGNGSRGLFSTPSPSPSNLILEPGETPLADLVAGIQRGLLVEHVLGLGQGNTISGAFSNTLGLAYAIERGEIAGRVKDVSIAGNIYEDLREVAGISRESYWVHGHFGMPYILLPHVNVVCKG